jgi:2-C-methyl-D-erythritol 4-phosphate cytidylyltransferase
MNYGLIIGGGSGNCMRQVIPKQFMHVDGCLIIIHTLNAPAISSNIYINN